MTMLDALLFYVTTFPVAFIAAGECCIVALSCFLLINSLPRKGRLGYKLVIAFVGFGAIGLALGPFEGVDLEPSTFDVLFRGGAALFSVHMTMPLWHELPFFNRRRIRCQCREHRREEDQTCVH